MIDGINRSPRRSCAASSMVVAEFGEWVSMFRPSLLEQPTGPTPSQLRPAWREHTNPMLFFKGTGAMQAMMLRAVWRPASGEGRHFLDDDLLDAVPV